MSTLTVQLTDSLKDSLEAAAANEGCSVDQFLVSAASEKLAALSMLERLRREAATARREDFENYLAASPDVPPLTGDEL